MENRAWQVMENKAGQVRARQVKSRQGKASQGRGRVLQGVQVVAKQGMAGEAGHGKTS
jgi:hypothetical protein